MQKLMAQFNMPGITSQQYDQIMNELDTSGYSSPKGQLQHIAVELPNSNWLITDIWDSQESMNNFAEVLIPILISHGVTPVQPTISPIYNYKQLV
jgi:hypothetical protein